MPSLRYGNVSNLPFRRKSLAIIMRVFYAVFILDIIFNYLHAERLHLLICNIYIRQQKS